MTNVNSLSRQPTSLDYASPTQFKFQITKLPKVEFFCTNVNLPGVELSSITQPTPFVDLPIPGTKIQYGQLNMSFLVDENLENYQEIHGWIRGMGFPDDYKEFRDLADTVNDRFPGASNSHSTEPGKVKYGATRGNAILSDATLIVLTSKNNPIVEARFKSLYPISISGLDFNQQADDVQYLSSTVTFNYSAYDFANVNASSTTVINT